MLPYSRATIAQAAEQYSSWYIVEWGLSLSCLTLVQILGLDLSPSHDVCTLVCEFGLLIVLTLALV